MARHFPGGPMVKTSPSNAGGSCLIPGWDTKIPHASQPKNQNIKQKLYCNKFNKDFKNSAYKKSSKKLKESWLLSLKTWLYWVMEMSPETIGDVTQVMSLSRNYKLMTSCVIL